MSTIAHTMARSKRRFEQFPNLALAQKCGLAESTRGNVRPCIRGEGGEIVLRKRFESFLWSAEVVPINSQQKIPFRAFSANGMRCICGYAHEIDPLGAAVHLGGGCG